MGFLTRTAGPSADQSIQTLMPGLPVPLEYIVERVEIGSDLLGLARAQVTLRKDQEARLLERLKYFLVLPAQLVNHAVHLG
jgi:hypothetical protein